MNKTRIIEIAKFQNAKKTKCLNGHTLGKKKNGKRLCLICCRLRSKKFHAKKVRETKKPKSKFDFFN
jgi:hypothetical protein